MLLGDSIMENTVSHFDKKRFRTIDSINWTNREDIKEYALNLDELKEVNEAIK